MIIFKQIICEMMIMHIFWIIVVLVLVTMIDISYQASKTRPHIYPHVANEGILHYYIIGRIN